MFILWNCCFFFIYIKHCIRKLANGNGSVKHLPLFLPASPGVRVEEVHGRTPTPTRWVTLSHACPSPTWRSVFTISRRRVVFHLLSLLSTDSLLIFISRQLRGKCPAADSRSATSHKLPVTAALPSRTPGTHCSFRSLLLHPSGPPRGRRPARNSHHAEPRRWVVVSTFIQRLGLKTNHRCVRFTSLFGRDGQRGIGYLAMDLVSVKILLD